MIADALLARLEKVQKTGHNRWKACCPAHDDKTPSLGIREEDDGRVLLHCFAGCSALDVITAVGLEWDALFPPRPLPPEGCRPIRRTFLPADAFETLRHEVDVVTLIAGDMLRGKDVPVEDHARLLVAQQQLDAVAQLCYGKS